MSIGADVERGLVVKRQLAELTEELKDIQNRLTAAGLARPEYHEDLVDEEREGKQWKAHSAAHIVPVVFTADVIVSSFGDLSAKHQTIRTALGKRPDLLKQFFAVPKTWKNKFDSGKKFRAHARELLEEAAGPFITACVARDKDGIARSAIKVEWDRASEVAS